MSLWYLNGTAAGIAEDVESSIAVRIRTVRTTRPESEDYTVNARIRRQLRALVGAAMFLLFPVLSHALINGGFEVPAVSPPSTGFSVYPSGSGVGWFFDPTKDGTGVSGKNSPFTSGNSLSGAGQVAFITNHGQISQTIFLPAGRHILSLLAVQRMNTQTGPQTNGTYFGLRGCP